MADVKVPLTNKEVQEALIHAAVAKAGADYPVVGTIHGVITVTRLDDDETEGISVTLSKPNVIPFKKKKLSEIHKGKGLCRSGFHKWEILTEQQFDVKKGKLVTALRCKRCGVTKTEAQ